ncbi:MAG: hypothetical protein V7629_12720 [Motiliproteus sp.]
MYLVTIVKQTALYIIPLAIPLLAGCQTPPSALEQNFGSSVRNMIQLQTAQSAERGSGIDGQKAEAVLGAYRADVAKPKSVEQGIIQIRLGN